MRGSNKNMLLSLVIQQQPMPPLWRRCACFVLNVVLCAALLSRVAHAQQPQTVPWKNPYAIPGCRMTFLLSTTALMVEAEWLDYSMASPSYGWKECPSQPFEVKHVYFSRSILDVLGISSGLGRRDLLLHADGSPVFQNEPQTFPAPANRVPGQPVEASIEMQKFGRSRNYAIRYCTSDETLAGTVNISCTDDSVNRLCHSVPRFAGLMVTYRASQDQFPAGHEASTDPSTESGAILQFDQRLREWLIGLERPR